MSAVEKAQFQFTERGADMVKRKVIWEPTPKQDEFLQCTEDEVLLGGAVGGGKSDGLLLFATLRRLAIPGSKGLILRRTFPELEMSLIARSRELYPGFGAKYQEQHHRWVFPNGSVQMFSYMEKDNDVYRYQSAAFEDICFDELTAFTEFQYTYMLSRLRTTKPGVLCFARGATNPGNIGHAFVRARFVTVAPPNTRYVDPESGTTRRFVPATLDDNPHLNADQYKQFLSNLPPEQHRMLRYGDWDAFSGQAFPEFRTEIHVVQPFPIPSWWRRWIANDPGYTDPFAWHWFAADQDGNVYCYREYTRDGQSERIAYSDQGREVFDRSIQGLEINRPEQDEGGRSVREQIDFVVTGMDAFNKHPEDGKSIIDYYREGGIPWGFIQPVHGPNSRRVRKAVFHEYLKWAEDKNTGKTTARLKIFNTCRKLVETLPTLVIDPRDREKVAECSIDHWFDSSSYGICAWHTDRAKAPESKKGLIRQDKEKLARAQTHPHLRRAALY
jgi:hypothetical protein